MAIFGIITNEDDKVLSFLNNTNHKLKEKNLLTNPFTGGVKAFALPSGFNNYTLSLFKLTPFYINLSFIGLMLMITLFILKGLTLWLIAPGIIFLSGFFWSKYFLFFILYLALRKKGYKGKISLISNKELLDILYFNDGVTYGTARSIRLSK
jgi:hypothetical protein